MFGISDQIVGSVLDRVIVTGMNSAIGFYTFYLHNTFQVLKCLTKNITCVKNTFPPRASVHQ